MSNGSEHMNEDDKAPEEPGIEVREINVEPPSSLPEIYSYSTLDEKIFRYENLTEAELQNIAKQFTTEIFFVLTGEEVEVITDDSILSVEGGVCSGLKDQHHPLCVVEDEEHPSHVVDVITNNLKEDFIYYHATINGASWWECTCGNFLETDAKGVDRMIKRAVAHARKSGHTINPRGN